MHRQEIRSLMCAMLLGDAYLRVSVKDPKHTVGGFWIEHSRAQVDYLKWKSDEIDKIFVQKNLPQRCNYYERDRFDRRTNRTYYSSILNLNWKSYLTDLDNRVYTRKHDGSRYKDVEYLLSQISTDKHLAIWMMDDGSESRTKSKHKDGKTYLRNPYFRLATQSFTEGQVNLVRQWFNSKYGVTPSKTKQRSGWIVQFSVADTRKLFPRIRPYVSNLESMRVKFRTCLERY